MKKGDYVLVKATAYTKYKKLRFGQEIIVREVKKQDSIFGIGYPRNLVKVLEDNPWKGIIVGRSVLISGLHFPGGRDYYGETNPGKLENRQYHKVIMVIPLHTQQWIKPYPCLTEDLELIEAK